MRRQRSFQPRDGDPQEILMATTVAVAAEEQAIRMVLERIESAWRRGEFAGLEDCFDRKAVIVGPGYVTYAAGRAACVESYREFASNADVLEYSESDHKLRHWGHTAVCTFSWNMTYQRDGGAQHDSGTDQLVLERQDDRWRVVYRHIQFAAGSASADA
jgi:ketosteroid isomerase-like protein